MPEDPDSDPDDWLAHDPGKVWGSTPSGIPIRESDLRLILTDSTCSLTVFDFISTWWVGNHAGILHGTWVAPVGLLQRCTLQGIMSPHRVRAHGPPGIDPDSARHLWFPIQDALCNWALVHYDLPAGVIHLHCNPTIGHLRQVRAWTTLWLGKRDRPVWETRHPTSDRHTFSTTAQFLEYALRRITDGPTTESVSNVESEYLLRFRRAVTQACRNALEHRLPDSSPDLPTTPKPHMTSAWRLVVADRYKASRLQRDQSQQALAATDTVTANWLRTWTSSQPLGHQQNSKAQVITVNVGPSGLQVCIKHLPKLLRGLTSLPMAIHLQDTKITLQRSRSIHDQLNRILPDYTAYHSLWPNKPGRRYNLGVTTLLRNDLALKCTTLSG
eukprot:2206252-Rhodomonas_salina.1